MIISEIFEIFTGLLPKKLRRYSKFPEGLKFTQSIAQAAFLKFVDPAPPVICIKLFQEIRLMIRNRDL